jgi:hypothetical protein
MGDKGTPMVAGLGERFRSVPDNNTDIVRVQDGDTAPDNALSPPISQTRLAAP